MKRALLAGLLALAAATQSFGQGYTEFDNYDAMPYMPIVYYSSGRGVTNASYHVDLLYDIGTTSSYAAMTDAGLSVAIDPSLNVLGNSGYFRGGVYTVTGYVSGPVSFAVECWQTTGQFGGATYAAADDKGISFIWQESALTTVSSAAFWSGLPGPDGSPLLSLGILIPEPSIFALFCLGAATFMVSRRKK